MKLLIQPTSQEGEVLALEVVQTLLDAARMQLVQVELSPIKAELVEELLEAQEPALFNDWEKWLAFAGALRKDLPKKSVDANVILVLLTNHGLPRRWFSIHQAPGCVVVDSSGWDQYVGKGRAHLAVAHLVATNALGTRVFPFMADWQQASHADARGCMMDLCQDKREIQAKLRAADLCTECAPVFKKAILSGQLSAPHFRHIMDMLEGIRRGLLNSRFQEIGSIQPTIELIGLRPRFLRLHPFEVDVALQPKSMALFLLAFFRGERLQAHQMNGEVWSQWDELTRLLKSTEKGLREGTRHDGAFGSTANIQQRNLFKADVARIRNAIQDRVGSEYLSHFLKSSEGKGGIAIPQALLATSIQMEPRFKGYLDQIVPKKET